MSRFRSHLTFSNVVATVALFVALGGGAYAAVGSTFVSNSGTIQGCWGAEVFVTDGTLSHQVQAVGDWAVTAPRNRHGASVPGANRQIDRAAVRSPTALLVALAVLRGGFVQGNDSEETQGSHLGAEA
jgi:hypothetical protein